ncbi:MAG: hypothetical protein MK137_07185 [Rickettsiales bacterium]|nr:hypothetical protein [Rickettsiales bacterium]
MKCRLHTALFVATLFSTHANASIDPNHVLQSTPLVKFNMAPAEASDYQRVVSAATKKADSINSNTTFRIVSFYPDDKSNSSNSIDRTMAILNGQVVYELLSKSGVSPDRITVDVQKSSSKDATNLIEIFVVPL